MATKIKLTRPELKRYRDALTRFERYLPMLKLKQQQLQLAVRQANQRRRQADEALQSAVGQFEPYSNVLADVAGLDVRALAKPQRVTTATSNIAGLKIPVFEDIEFAAAQYSLFATPPWVDSAMLDLRRISRCQAELQVLQQQCDLLRRELTKISQRVNLFEKVKIPEAAEAIRVIRISLGDEMTAAVGRAKIAKAKIAESAGLADRNHQSAPPETTQP